MVDFFDEDNEVFVKLHKPVNKDILYWETWNVDEKTAVIHWGKLGEIGDKKDVVAASNEELKKEINLQLNKLMADGYEDIPYKNYFWMVLTFEMESLGTPEKDSEQQEDLRSMVTSILGWTGNGSCDDSTLENDQIVLFADVLNPEIALRTLKEEFQNEKITGEFFVTIMQGDDVLKENVKVSLKRK